MRIRTVAALAACLLASPALAGPAEDAALAPFRTQVDDVNAGDMKAAAKTFTANAAIVDEFAPFLWQGKAFAGWSAGYAKWAKTNGVTDTHLTIAQPTEMNMGTDVAYAVVPGHLTFSQNGKPGSEDGTFSLVVKRYRSGWKVAAWAWATKP